MKKHKLSPVQILVIVLIKLLQKKPNNLKQIKKALEERTKKTKQNGCQALINLRKI